MRGMKKKKEICVFSGKYNVAGNFIKIDRAAVTF